MHPIKTPKKLIEVALPLDLINAACTKEKSIRHGHPSTLHLWWARRPLAAARAVIFSQMVNDPGYERNLGRGVNKEKARIERERLFSIISKLVLWENTNNEEVIAEARAEIWKSWRETCELNRGHPQALTLFNPEKLPAFHDPFAGGGTLPLEAQRLGLESFASDLNPVAVLINKAMIEIPSLFDGAAPVGPLQTDDRQGKLSSDWSRARGLGEDIRRYGSWIQSEAIKRIGHLYPKVGLPKDLGGGEATVVAWLWARTVKSPNPAYSHVEVPLASTFVVSSKKGREAYIVPVVSGDKYHFEIRYGTPSKEAVAGTKVGRGGHFQCIFSSSPIHVDYIREEGKAGRMGARLMAVVAEGRSKRTYLAPDELQERVLKEAQPTWIPNQAINHNPRDIRTQLYGLMNYSDLFTPRQLIALTTFSDLIQEVREQAKLDAIKSGMSDDGVGLESLGCGATAYGEAMAVYLSFALSKLADRGSSICTWFTERDSTRNTFARQSIPMTWDFAELNTLLNGTGSFMGAVDWTAESIEGVACGNKSIPGVSKQADATSQNLSANKVVSTDPPYYDNIGYADLSDFFYVWLRRTLRPVYPNLFQTMAVPKAEELVATPYRHGNKEKAESFFLTGMTNAMHRLAEQVHPAFPTSIYYAFKQSDTTDIGTGNTGWETFLEAVLRAGFAITGTWPMRTELSNRMVGSGANALASSIVLVCRQREKDSPTISRRE